MAEARTYKKRSGDIITNLADNIRDAILSGIFAAGEPVPESKVVEQFACSRASAREALRLVLHSGLVIKTPNQSYRVIVPNEHDLHEITSLRWLLEEFAARLAFGREELALNLASALEDLRKSVQDRDLLGSFRANRRFHEGIIHAARHRRLADAYRQMSDQIEFAFMALNYIRPAWEQVITEHEKLYKIACEGTFEEFREELAFHIQSPIKHLIEPWMRAKFSLKSKKLTR